MTRRDADGTPFDLIALFRRSAQSGLIDQPIRVEGEGGGPDLALRLVAVKKPEQAAEAARRQARRAAQREGDQISDAAPAAADRVIIVTSPTPDETLTAPDVIAPCRLR